MFLTTSVAFVETHKFDIVENEIAAHEDVFDRIEGCHYFTIMDMRQGFNQIEMRPKDKEKA